MEIMENNKGGKKAMFWRLYVHSEVQDTINHTSVCLSVCLSVRLL